MSDDTFAIRVGRLRRALRREFDCRAADLGVTASQVQVLRRLWAGDGILTTALTKEVCSDGGTMTGVLDRLEAKGLIRRERCEEDRRAVRIRLTPEGKALEDRLIGVLEALDEHALRGFSSEERSALMGALERVGANLDAW